MRKVASDKEKGGKEKEIPTDAAGRADKAAFGHQGDFGQARQKEKAR